jgi:hypothetical protein
LAIPAAAAERQGREEMEMLQFKILQGRQRQAMEEQAGRDQRPIPVTARRANSTVEVVAGLQETAMQPMVTQDM